MTAPRTPTSGALLGLLVTLALLAGCAGLPEDGAVRAGEAESPAASSAPFDFNPPGPVPSATPEQVVAGFLRALQANPVSTRVAKEFLTEDAADAWRPDRRTIVYGAQSTTVPTGAEQSGAVRVTLERSFDLDETGRWAGAWPGERPLRLRLVRDGQEWRIAELPDALVIPQSHFEARYRRYSLYFFDLSGAVLVPVPVYLHWGPQTPTQLVSGLLAGPPPEHRAVERSFFPSDVELSVSVPVGSDGTATVPLEGSMADLEEDRLQRAVAQLAWTLRQVDEVDSLEVTTDGTVLDLPGGGSAVDVGEWTEFSPTIASASTDVFGLRQGSVVQLAGEEALEAAAVPPGWGRVDSLGVEMNGQRFALVGPGGEVRVVTRSTDEEPAVTAYDGTDVLRPMWDRTDRLWLVDRTDAGARVLVVEDGRVRSLRAPGLAGREVSHAALSRDGTRLAAVVPAADGGERLVLARVVRRNGRPVRLTAAVPLATPRALDRVAGLGWRDPTTVALLTRPSDTTSEVVLASVDGSSRRVAVGTSLDVLFEEAVALAASPGGPLELLVGTPTRQLHSLGEDGRWDLDVAEVPLRAPTFVG